MKQLLLSILIIFFIAMVGAIELPLGGTDAQSGISIESLPSVEKFVQITSQKINPLLKQEALQIREGKVEVIAHFINKITVNQNNELQALVPSIKYHYSIINAAAFSVDVSLLDTIADLPFIKTLEYDAPTQMFLAQSTTQIGASRVWLAHGAEGKGVTIAVLDTGIDNNHPDLTNVVSEQDFTGEGTDDFQGHGTHVASTIAGSGAGSGGINKGVAPKATLMDVKVLDKTGSGKLSDTIAGIEWAVLHDADIISMSLGAQIPCNGLDATSLASDAAVARGVHVIVAAGNAGPLPASIGSPGCAREVITVGAVDRLDGVALFSSRGPTLDGRIKPDLVAPGVLIIAAKNGGGYTALSGTSMATPHVAGVVALILGQHKDLSPSQIKKVLMETAKDLGEDKNTQGDGRIQAYDAFIAATGLEAQNPPVEEENPQNPDNEQKSPEDTPNQESGKKKAERKSMDKGYVDTVTHVDEKAYEGKKYYVVEGYKNENPAQVVRVWVAQSSGEIERVETMGYLARLWQYIKNFFASLLWFI